MTMSMMTLAFPLLLLENSCCSVNLLDGQSAACSVGKIPRVVYIRKKKKMSESAPSAPSAPVVATAATAGGRKAGRGNYTREEMMNFLNIMARILPIGGEEFDEVLQEHTLDFPGRDVDSLRPFAGGICDNNHRNRRC
jgi:hypothetical protein